SMPEPKRRGRKPRQNRILPQSSDNRLHRLPEPGSVPGSDLTKILSYNCSQIESTARAATKNICRDRTYKRVDEYESKEHDLSLVRQGRARGSTLLCRDVSG